MVAAVFLQGLLGKLLMEFSSWVFPKEVTLIGMFGAAIANPLFFGLYLLPFTTWALYWLLKKAMVRHKLK